MSYFNTCPDCGAHLDPCETCDCMKNAAPVLQHKDGAEQICKTVSKNIVLDTKSGCQHEDILSAIEMADSVKRLALKAVFCASGVPMDMGRASRGEIKRAIKCIRSAQKEHTKSAALFESAITTMRIDFLMRRGEQV